MEDVQREVAELVVVSKTLVEAQKDHESRLRRIEYFLLVVFGALGIYRWLSGSLPIAP